MMTSLSSRAITSFSRVLVGRYGYGTVVPTLTTTKTSIIAATSNRAEQQHCFSTQTLRRPRIYRRPEQQNAATPKQSDFGKLEEPFEHGEADLETYLAKTSLSPWVPLPDVVARKVMDLSQAGTQDNHVDLGSGDGRVCFHALSYGVANSVGIDVDENIVQVAQQRMAKRHPQPPNLSFVVADLLDANDPVWEEHVQQASLITMYFATEALEILRPLLEQKLVGRTCKIVTCGYEMPGWQAAAQEVVLGTQIHLYMWGSEMEDDEDDDFFFSGPDILNEKPEELLKNPLETSKFEGANVIDSTGRHMIRGFNPSIFEEEEDDEDWDFDSSDDDDDEKQKEQRGIIGQL
jgi:SAM-dependent methyltransferase